MQSGRQNPHQLQSTGQPHAAGPSRGGWSPGHLEDPALLTHDVEHAFPESSLAIALGANLPSPAGPPRATLLAVRPLLQTLLQGIGATLHWSPLFRTAAVGGPAGQADYLNAVLVMTQVSPADPARALWLLGELQELERRFARQRRIHWGPRSLDLDLLWWGELQFRNETLELPHPRLLERAFVLAPLATVNPILRPPGTCTTSTELLAQVQRATPDLALKQLPGRPGWPE